MNFSRGFCELSKGKEQVVIMSHRRQPTGVCCLQSENFIFSPPSTTDGQSLLAGR